jgi:histidinol-phosphate/aromatic aminotransferase/cobyric acid decarboxylase-like protein
VLAPYTSKELAIKLLDQNILIKDLAGKTGFDGKQYVRIAVRNEKDNDRLIASLHTFEIEQD